MIGPVPRPYRFPIGLPPYLKCMQCSQTCKHDLAVNTIITCTRIVNVVPIQQCGSSVTETTKYGIMYIKNVQTITLPKENSLHKRSAASAQRSYQLKCGQLPYRCRKNHIWKAWWRNDLESKSRSSELHLFERPYMPRAQQKTRVFIHRSQSFDRHWVERVLRWQITVFGRLARSSDFGCSACLTGGGVNIRRSSGTNCCHVPHNWLASFPRDQSNPVRAFSVCMTKRTTGTPAKENALATTSLKAWCLDALPGACL